ncbi:MAG: DUF2239 family protein [Deltaproteobacteria bacterium]|nr:DUF2239 family protein [Deltaproteobacteria bacterium]
MSTNSSTFPTVVAFAGPCRIAAGPLPDVARVVRERLDAGEVEPVIVLDDETAAPVDIDLRGTPEDVAARILAEAAQPTERQAAGPGRPRLGVVSREVSLLPRHWEWLADQPGGASATLRRLVEDARRTSAHTDRTRRAREATWRFLHVMAGDRPGFEEASRALFADRLDDLARIASEWPPDVRDHALRLASRIAGG